MGTYILKPFSVQSQAGSWFGYDGAALFSANGADLVTGANNPATALPVHTASALTVYGGSNSSHSAASNSNDILRFGFDFSNSIYLDGAGSPTAFSALAAGFTPTSATAQFRDVISGSDATQIVHLQFDPFTQSTNLAPIGGAAELKTFAYPGNIPSILNLLGNGMGINIDNRIIGSRCILEFLNVKITGNYSILSYTWYYNPNTNHFQYLTTNPGAPWIPQTPNLSVLTVNPNQGPFTFPPVWNASITSETVTITGTGFGDGAVATLDGVPVLDDVVGNQTNLVGNVGGFAGTLSGPNSIVIDGEDPQHSGFNGNANTSVGNVTVWNPDGSSASLVNGWTYYQLIPSWWQTISLPFIWFGYYSPADPQLPPFPPFSFAPFTFPFGFFYNGIWYPPNITFVWTNLPAPSKPGWWLSINNDFNGAAFDVAQTSPHNPRSFDEIASFATSSAGMLGGFPGPCCVWNNRLVYAEGGYTVGVSQPPIDIFDGSFNHTITLVPNTAAGVVPQCIVTMLAANGVVYFSTLDSGGVGTYSGRVFSLNINTGQVTQMGVTTDFATGDVPYALTFFASKLWCGTNRGDASAGHVYWIRPGVDTNWTLDRSLSADSVGGVDSMTVYQGNLYIGTNATSGTFAKMLKRDTSGNYTTSDTGTGGVATTNNGYLASAVFGNNLYASYWNGDSPLISKIRQFNGSTWSTVYTGTGDTLVPFIGFPSDNSNFLAIGGGLTYPAALVTTTDGVTWIDNTVFLTQISPPTTALPAFGVVIR